MSLRAYARHRDVSPSYVHRLIREGVIARDAATGLIDSVAADRAFDAHRAVARPAVLAMHRARRAARRQAAQVATDEVPIDPAVADAALEPTAQAPVAAVDELSATASFAVARTERERINAEMARLELEQVRGTLVLRADVERAIADAMAPALARLDALSAALSPKLAGVSETRTLQSTVDDEVVLLRQEMANAFAAMLGERRQ